MSLKQVTTVCAIYLVHCFLDPLLCEINFIVFVVHNQGISAGHSSRGITVFVVNKDLKIVSRNDLFDQDIGAVFLEAVILAIKCHIMRVSPAIANTCKN